MVQRGWLHLVQTLMLELGVQYSGWEIESGTLRGGYVPNFGWETIGRGDLYEGQHPWMDRRIGTLLSPEKSMLTGQLQAYFLVADDMMDASYTRRGQPCWYKRVTSPMWKLGLMGTAECRYDCDQRFIYA